MPSSTTTPARQGYALLLRVLAPLQCLFLLAIRLYWGWQFHLTGTGKLKDISQPADFFASLHIPFPLANAYLVGTLECVGGLLLMIGLASRLISIPLSITLFVAYATADNEALRTIFADDNDPFLKSTPLTFLFVTLTVLLFGPGRASVDYLLERFYWRKGETSAKPAA